MYPIKEIRLLFVSSWFPSCHSIIKLTIVIAISMSLLPMIRSDFPNSTTTYFFATAKKKFCYQISFTFTRVTKPFCGIGWLYSLVIILYKNIFSFRTDHHVLFLFCIFYGRSMVRKNVTSAHHVTTEFDPIVQWDKR